MNELKDYRYDQYFLYPTLHNNAWKDIFLSRLNSIDGNADFNTFNLEVSKWDEEHFGFKIGKINNPFSPIKEDYKQYKYEVKRLIEVSKENNVRVLILRINGDNINLIHEFENVGFRYYETIIWPVTNLDKQNFQYSDIRLFDSKSDNIDDLMKIARYNQYNRGHFHCDNNFEITKVNELYAKWVKTAAEENRHIAIIRNENKIVGYFVFAVDEKLSLATGYKYGRLQSLALDSRERGKGLGRKLFEGTLSLLKEYGCIYADSGYASKNHLSAKLHSMFGFSSVYEEVTMHLWL
ncbi:MAG: GNAT family N-acetyltransferase [Chitinophagaceae bacterium]|nr:GNAT family N-acetyltransferase [Chitinophagaceae bacterium]